MKIPRLVLAGTHSGVGKTTLTLGILAALRQRGLKIQPFKVGPDYIDPGLHQVAAGEVSHNLDSWMGSPAALRRLFRKHAGTAEFSLVEGVMGLFDGAKGEGEAGSTAQVAKILKAPVVLVFSAGGLARSAAALISGYRNFDPDLQLAGVIANGIGSSRHREFIQDVVEGELGLPWLGALHRDADLTIPGRHLGLLPAAENKDLGQVLERLGQSMEQQLDLDGLLLLARQAPFLEKDPAQTLPPASPVRLAVARDEAFHFYYQDSLDYLEELGADLHYFSPLKDRSLPREADGIYIGGGFPEEFLPLLTSNQPMKSQIQRAWSEGMPIYAECGGLMYLCRQIAAAGQEFPGVGLVPSRVQMGKKLAALGYVRARLRKPSLLGGEGTELKGHEFHWSTMEELPQEDSAYCLKGGRGGDGRLEGYARENLLASYVHLHFRYHPGAAQKFLACCAAYRKARWQKDG
ncbi:cobyrinate a,c-diamide synthase [Desulforamulus ruminis]|uniref:cobyrinate a,c-diamide synthase n=1 Tax=Desulforamulus ruminis TaxID=1564 RepID=UPI002FD8CC0B